jgi:hypothetical protein
MMIKAAVLVPNDDEHALIPARRLTDNLIDLLDELFAGPDAPKRMLRIAVAKVVH